MKNLTTILLLLFVFTSNAQTETSKSPKDAEVTAPILVCSNAKQTRWFAMKPTFKKVDGTLTEGYITTQKMNIGSCSKNDVIVFTFLGENGKEGKKIYIPANNSKNCDIINPVTFTLTSVDVAYLVTKTIMNIRYVNGNDQTSFVYETKKSERYYFIGILKKIIL
jgi:hypothetical protein